MLTMQGSVRVEIRVGTNQGVLFKVMEGKNKKMWKYWFVYLCEYLFVCRKLEIMNELEEGAKGNLQTITK